MYDYKTPLKRATLSMITLILNMIFIIYWSVFLLAGSDSGPLMVACALSLMIFILSAGYSICWGMMNLVVAVKLFALTCIGNQQNSQQEKLSEMT